MLPDTNIIIISSLVIGIYFPLGFCLSDIKAEDGVQLLSSNIWQPQGVISNCAEHDYNGQLSRIGSAKPASSELELVKRGQRWTSEEKELLLKLKEQNMSWKDISKFFPGRNWSAVTAKYNVLKKSQSTAENKQDEVKSWTDEQKKLLLELKKANLSWVDIIEALPEGSLRSALAHYFPWVDTAEALPERSLQSVLLHYFSLPSSPQLPTAEKSVRHYTAEEDALLLELVESGVPWKQRQAYFKNRTLASLISRDSLLRRRQGKTSPRASPKSFTPEEDDLIVKAVKSGMDQAEIGRLIGRYRGSIRGRIKKLEKLNRLDPTRQKSKGSPYTAADLELIRTKANEGMSWEDIATQYFPTRTARGIRNALEYNNRKKRKKQNRDEE